MLEEFVVRCIIALLERGAVPVKPSPLPGIFWEKQTNYGESADFVATEIVGEWLRAGHDPDHDDLWFARID